MAKRHAMYCLTRLGRNMPCDCGAVPVKPLPGQMALPMAKPATPTVKPTLAPTPTTAKTVPAAKPSAKPIKFKGPYPSRAEVLAWQAAHPPARGLYRCKCGAHVLSNKEPSYNGHTKEGCP